MDGTRRWSLEAARSICAEVREHTAKAVEEADALVAERDALGAGDPRRKRVEARLREVVSRWIRSMEALGVEVKGPWLVDFDNGSGYYCWKWPEEELAWYHGYEDGFAGRVRIQ